MQNKELTYINTHMWIYQFAKVALFHYRRPQECKALLFIPGLRRPVFSCCSDFKTEKWLQIIFSLEPCQKKRWKTFIKLREKLLWVAGRDGPWRTFQGRLRRAGEKLASAGRAEGCGVSTIRDFLFPGNQGDLFHRWHPASSCRPRSQPRALFPGAGALRGARRKQCQPARRISASGPGGGCGVRVPEVEAAFRRGFQVKGKKTTRRSGRCRARRGRGHIASSCTFYWKLNASGGGAGRRPDAANGLAGCGGGRLGDGPFSPPLAPKADLIGEPRPCPRRFPSIDLWTRRSYCYSWETVTLNEPAA